MLTTMSERVPLLKVLQSRTFTLLWTGQFISIVGDNVFTVALAWQVLILTGSAEAMSAVVIAKLIPTIIFLLVGGVTADRLPRRVILLCSDVGRGLVVGIIATLSALHSLHLWHLLVFSFFFGIVDGFFSPAYQAIQPQLVPRDLLQSANSLTRFATLIGGIIGPALGALCVALAGPASAFALDACSFLISAICLTIMRLPTTTPLLQANNKDTAATEVEAPPQLKGFRGLVADVQEGLKYITSSTWLWVTITIASLANITFFGPIAVALPKLVRDFYHQGAWLLGSIDTAWAVGAIAATLLMGQLRHIRHRGLLAYFALLPCGLGITLLGLPLPLSIEPTVATCAGAFAGFSIGVFSIIWITLLQELVPVEKLGRVSSIDMMGSYVFLPIGIAFIGVLADHIGPSPVFIVGGLITTLLVSIGLCFRDIRQLA